jgi:phospholysine phosphohistidine inorganic pyrophosphate phosphatase
VGLRLSPPRAYLLDLDGTLYADGAAIPGAVAALARLRRQKVPFRLVTNTTSRSRSMLVDRLRGFGFDVAPGELFTATLSATHLAQAAGYRSVAPFVPEAALEDMAGLDLIGGTSNQTSTHAPQAVLVGDLSDRWSYGLLQEAFEYIMAGAALIALSRDRYWLHQNKLALDAGPFVAALEFATKTDAIVAGKPSPGFYTAALQSLDLSSRDSVAMIGDDLWSDVEGAQRAGLQGWLVRTGKYRDATLQQSGVVPDRILDSVAELG